MAVSRAEIVDQNLRSALASAVGRPAPGPLDGPVAPGRSLTARRALELLESMMASRLLDLEARVLKARNEGFYTIGSSGHECNAAVADVLRPTDPAFLHYRSGGFFVRRARQVPGQTPLLDVLLGIVASTDEPIAGGRHKVFGSLALQIPPQTSTIASHLPKAVGAAFTLARMERLGIPGAVPADSVVVCTFGDASSNHSTACGAFNAASIARHQNLPCPVLFVCEDNGIGISTHTPDGWVESRFAGHPHLRYFGCDGLDLADTWDTAAAAAAYVRETRRPAFLHLKLVRLLGHAGSDVEQSYRSTAEIEASEAQDPVLRTALALVEAGWITPVDALALYDGLKARIHALGWEAQRRPRLMTAAEVVEPLAPLRPAVVEAMAAAAPPAEARGRFFKAPPEDDRPRHLAVQINRALADLMAQHPELVLFGEDVARKGGVYNVTNELEARAGVGRVFNTPLDETTILGLALGAGQLGLLPFPEIQYLAYLHNAIDQLRGEAGSLQFFSNGQFRNPMVVRIAGLAYQKGFGGHFHNDNGLAALRDIPGLLIAVPSNGEDAVGLLRTLAAAAKADGRVCVFIEPIALYMTKDLHADKDGAWSFAYPGPGFTVPVGRGRLWGDGTDLTIITFANGVWMSLRVARRLEARGIGVRVLDLRWLNPLPDDDIAAAAAATGRVLVVDETRRTGGVSEGVFTVLVERCPAVRAARVTGVDTYIPLGDAANRVLVQEPDIEAAALALLER